MVHSAVKPLVLRHSISALPSALKSEIAATLKLASGLTSAPLNVTFGPELMTPVLFMSQENRAPLVLRQRMSLTPLSLKSGGVVSVMTWPRTLAGLGSSGRDAWSVQPKKALTPLTATVGIALVAVRQLC